MFTTEFSMLLTVFEMFCLDEAEVETVLLFVVEVSLFLLFIYSIFFDFELKLLFLIIDFILSFFEVDNINNLSIKIIVITLIDINLFVKSKYFSAINAGQ